MLEIKYFREHLRDVEASEKKRGKKLNNVKKVIEYDNKWRNSLKEVEKLRAKRNLINVEISKKRKLKQNADAQIKQMRVLTAKINNLQKKSDFYLRERDVFRSKVGNILDNRVPFGKSEEDNKILRFVGKKPKFSFKHKDHIELGLSLDLFDFDSAAKISGSRFVYFKNEAAILDWALQMYAIETLVKNGFSIIWPPLMLNKKAISAGINLQEFEDTIYKIEGEDLYLIGTSELPLVALHFNEVLDVSKLPLFYGGISPCFRKEAGTHGKDDKGTIRMHQFNKAEQVVFSRQEDSDKLFNKLQKISEQFFKDLGIPFRVVAICSADIGDKQSLQYDIEAWFPGQNNKKGAYREVTSCSNCKSYQSVNANIRYLENGEKKYVHILNNTMVATSRAIPAILENHQQKDGSVKIPSCLWKYCGFRTIKQNH